MNGVANSPPIALLFGHPYCCPRTSLRSKLTEEQIQWLSNEMRTRFKWSEEPRFFQLEGVKAQLEGTDIIIQAPTGAGKTALAAGPHLWPGCKGKVTIMVCPLLALQEEMVTTFRDEFGLSAIAVNSAKGSCSAEIANELLSDKHQIVLISPEMLQSPSFVNRVLRKPSFGRKVMSLFIDEAHCVSHWGADFRKKYASLGIIRAFLPRGTPVIAVTATLTARVRRDIHRVLHFTTSSRFVNVGNDRPNVAIVVRAFEHAQNSFLDLDFLIPPAASLLAPCDIPKTYVYVDDINTGNEIVDHLDSMISTRCPALASTGLVRPFNAAMSHEYRQESMNAFRTSPGCRTTFTPGCIRILVCTDAAGMGCNVKDVDIVVQWKLPKTLSSWVQRAGRAARSPHRTGLAVLLVERATYSIDLRRPSVPKGPLSITRTSSKPASGPSTSKPATSQVPKDYPIKHGLSRGSTSMQDGVPTLPTEEQAHLDLDANDEGLRVFVQATTCRRKIWAAVFESPQQVTTAQSCCDICHPTLLDRTRPGKATAKRKARLRTKGHPDYDAQDQLESWREMVFERDHSSTQLDPTAILDDSMITTLTTVGPLTKHQVASLLDTAWIWWPRYGEQLSTLSNQEEEDPSATYLLLSAHRLDTHSLRDGQAHLYGSYTRP
ncbi:P-loop containing nucleoside triphosphate hydrolase protein [Cubamyces lactineus]|nr:P-loop containing nucleoside triphosphate hydrolase protein [Cubamyces lactineus]